LKKRLRPERGAKPPSESARGWAPRAVRNRVDFYELVIGVLVVWRITHLLFAEDGPWDMVIRLRRQAGAGFWGTLLDCFNCLSLWIAAPFTLLLGAGWTGRLLLWPALSAGAILLQRLTSRDATS
jgi:hypothetical protein